MEKTFRFVGCVTRLDQEKRQIHHKPGLTQRSCPRKFSTTEKQIVMIRLRVAALTNARKPGFSAFIFTDVETPTGNSADYKQTAADDLGQMGLVARTEGIFFGTPTGRSLERTTMAVVAEVNDDADRCLRMVVGGRPLAGSVMQADGHFDGIAMRDGSTKSTVWLLPFDGDAYGAILIKSFQVQEQY